MMRITEATTAGVMAQGIDGAYNAFEQLAQQVSSGLAITKPSDDPAGTLQVMSYDAQISRAAQYQRNATDGLGWLGAADSSLSTVQTQLQRVLTLVEQGANGTTDASGRGAIAVEIQAIRSNLLADANATYLGRPIFGGTTGSATAYDAAGNYLGNALAVTRSVSDGPAVQVNVTGPDVFGDTADPAGNLFNQLDAIVAHLGTGSPALGTTDLSNVQAALTRASAQQATVGARFDEIQSLQTQAQSRQTTLTTALSNVQDLDMAKAETQLSTQQITYQAALEATSRVLSLSLADFLR